MSKSFYQKEEATLSHSWNDVPQPLTKLKSVLSRIQSGSNNKRNSEGTIKKNIRADVKTKNTYIAYLSYVADELMKSIQVKNTCSKYGINYHHVFYGSDIVVRIEQIIKSHNRK
jgi:hypothetical protein